MAVTIREHLVSASDPGAVGADKLWIDTTTTPYVLKIRDGANAAWVVVIITAADLADLTDGGATTLHVHAAGAAAGSNTQVQFNDGGAFAGDADLTFDKSTNLLAAKKILLAAGGTAAGSAPLKLTAGPLMTTVEEGALEFKGHTLYMTTFQVRRSVALVQEVPIADVTATAATETTVYSVPVAANYLTVGKHIEINLQGIFSSIAGPNGVVTIRLKYAGATITTFTTVAALNTNSPFDTVFNTTCRAIGSGTTGKLLSWSEFAEGATSATESVTRAAGALTNIDTTGSNTIDITVQFATANAGNAFTVQQGHTLCLDANT
jgi:hypothetical protein